MKFNKRHLAISLALLVGSIVYNVWVFTRVPDGVAGQQPAALNSVPVPGAAPTGAPVAIDPTQVAAPPDVALDRIPEWPRNPFAGVDGGPIAALEPVDPAVPEPAPELDPVVASILHSADRRLAMVNGRIVRVGDAIGDATVVDIQPKAVVIESAGRGRRTLRLDAARAAGDRP